eukprot:scaffold4.g4980.t1
MSGAEATSLGLDAALAKQNSPAGDGGATLVARLLSCLGARRWRVTDGDDLPSHGGEAADGLARKDSAEWQCPADFGDLPEHLLEAVFRHLVASRRQYHFAISSAWCVCCVTSRAGVSTCRADQDCSPRPVSGSRSGLLKCFVRRDSRPSGGGGTRFTFYMGRDPKLSHRARFLLCAVQASRSEFTLFLNSRAEGRPVGRLAANSFGTQYRLELAGMTLVGTLPPPGCAAYYAAAVAGRSRAAGAGGGRAPPGAPAAASWGRDAAAEAAAAAAAQQQREGIMLFAELKYKARVKGFMQPRRMKVLLPHPSQLSFQQALPHLACAPSPRGLAAAGGSRSTAAAAVAQGSGLGAAGAGEPSPSAEPVTPRFSAAPNTEGSLLPSLPGTPAASPVGPEHQAKPEASGLLPAGSSRMSRLLLKLGLSQASAACVTSGPNPAASEQPTSSGGGTVARDAVLHPRPWGAALAPPAPAPPPAPLPPVVLHNKAPHWNDGLRCWCLNFRGRVKLASVKNFQAWRFGAGPPPDDALLRSSAVSALALVREDDEAERVVMQFGKVDTDAYILDFKPTVLTAFQAFAICLSTFDSKLML